MNTIYAIFLFITLLAILIVLIQIRNSIVKATSEIKRDLGFVKPHTEFSYQELEKLVKNSEKITASNESIGKNFKIIEDTNSNIEVIKSLVRRISEKVESQIGSEKTE